MAANKMKIVMLAVILPISLIAVLRERSDFLEFGYCQYPKNVVVSPCDSISIAYDDNGLAYAFVSRNMTIFEQVRNVVWGYALTQNKECIRDLVVNADTSFVCGNTFVIKGYAPNQSARDSSIIQVGFVEKRCIEIDKNGVAPCRTMDELKTCKMVDKWK
jgi:hypothetical protein